MANRNNQLNDSALAMGQFVGAGEISRDEVEHRLFGAAVANGYVGKDGDRAARATIKSGLDAGERQPRATPAPLHDALPDGDNAWIGRTVVPKAANDNERNDTIDAKSLLAKHFEEMRYVIPGYVVEVLTIVGGKPKLGKSWLAYDFGVAVASGGDAMEAYRVNPATCFISLWRTISAAPRVAYRRLCRPAARKAWNG